MRAAIHPKDGTCRPQLLEKESNPEYYAIINEFRLLTGVPAVLNTSLNLHGYPLVYTPQDAIDVFLRSDLRMLLLGKLLLEK
jgi:carbamoyltransferase